MDKKNTANTANTAERNYISSIITTASIQGKKVALTDSVGRQYVIDDLTSFTSMFKKWWENVFASNSNTLTCLQVEDFDATPMKVVRIVKTWRE